MKESLCFLQNVNPTSNTQGLDQSFSLQLLEIARPFDLFAQ